VLDGVPGEGLGEEAAATPAKPLAKARTADKRTRAKIRA